MNTQNAAHTPGPCTHGFNDGSGVADEHENQGGYIVAGEHPSHNASAVIVRGGKDEWGCAIGVLREADARLIAEAFNVAHETGLTPRQLAEQRAELLAIAKSFVANIEEWDGEPLPGQRWHKEFFAAKALIAKAQGGEATAPEIFPGTLAQLDRLTVKAGAK